MPGIKREATKFGELKTNPISLYLGKYTGFSKTSDSFSVSQFLSYGRLIPLIKRLEYNLRDFNNIYFTSLKRTNCPDSLKTVLFSLSLADVNENIHTYILYCYLPNGAFQEQLFKLLKLLITTQLKLIKFKKHLQHYLNFVVEKNTKNK